MTKEIDTETYGYMQDKDDDLDSSDHSIYECIAYITKRLSYPVYIQIFYYMDWTCVEDRVRSECQRVGITCTIFEVRDSESFDFVNCSDSYIMVKLKNRKRFRGNRFVVARHGEVEFIPYYDPKIHDNIDLDIDAFKYYVFEER